MQDEILHLLETLEGRSFTHLLQATGSGNGGGTRMNDEIWPGENCVYMIATDAGKAGEIKKWIRRYREASLREGMKLFVLPLTEVI
jgi:hypothetical protein